MRWINERPMLFQDEHLNEAYEQTVLHICLTHSLRPPAVPPLTCINCGAPLQDLLEDAGDVGAALMSDGTLKLYGIMGIAGITWPAAPHTGLEMMVARMPAGHKLTSFFC